MRISVAILYSIVLVPQNRLKHFPISFLQERKVMTTTILILKCPSLLRPNHVPKEEHSSLKMTAACANAHSVRYPIEVSQSSLLAELQNLNTVVAELSLCLPRPPALGLWHRHPSYKIPGGRIHKWGKVALQLGLLQIPVCSKVSSPFLAL